MWLETERLLLVREKSLRHDLAPGTPGTGQGEGYVGPAVVVCLSVCSARFCVSICASITLSLFLTLTLFLSFLVSVSFSVFLSGSSLLSLSVCLSVQLLPLPLFLPHLQMMLNLEKKPVEAGIRYGTQQYLLIFRNISVHTSEKHFGAFVKENSMQL